MGMGSGGATEFVGGYFVLDGARLVPQGSMPTAALTE